MNNIYEISKDEINIPTKYIKDNLNPKIWDENDKMRPEVSEKLIKIAKEYYKFLDIKTPIEKVTMTGSLANYNWTETSDVDLHLIIDYGNVNEDEKLVKDYLDAKKANWNDAHNIKIYGYDVETYAQDKDEKHNSTGVYDIGKNEWIRKPEREPFKINKNEIKNKIKSLVDSIEKFQNETDDKKKYSIGVKLKERIKKMRQDGLDKNGEFSIENLAFKYLRNEGYLERLFGETRIAFDSALSLGENSDIVENLRNIYKSENWGYE